MLRLLFRIALLLEVLLSALMALTVAWASPMPSDLNRYLRTLSQMPDEGPMGWILAATELVAIVGLFFFRRGARELYVAMVIVSLGHTIVQGLPAVLPSATYVTIQVERIVVGVIVGLAYWSPIAGSLSIRRTSRGKDHAVDQADAADGA